MKLATYLDDNSIKDADFSEQIGVSRQAVHRYREGDRFPSPKVLNRIFEVTNGEVTANDFAGHPDHAEPERAAS